MTSFLYRLWNGDQLLYIGISKSYLKRLTEHMDTQPWAGSITKVTTEVYNTRKLAAQAERLAVQTEKPLHNILLQKKETPQESAQRQWAEMSPEDRQKTMDILRKIACVRLDENTDKTDNIMGRVSRLLLLTNAGDSTITWTPP